MSVNFNINPQIKVLIEQIVFLIKIKGDYQSAANIMLENNIDLSTLIGCTYKLKDRELAILTDKILLSK